MFGLITKFMTALAIMNFVALDAAWSADNRSQSNITFIPQQLDRACRSGRARLYDECTNQLTIFEAARERAAAENKTLLVSYGAEWCIWCHVFAAYIKGESDKFTYTYGGPDNPEERETSTLRERAKSDPTAAAAALNAYVSTSFVVVHIDAQYSPEGDTVLHKTGASAHYRNSIPFLFTVDSSGRYAGSLVDQEVQIRRDSAKDWYRGYDRTKLLEAMKAIHAKAAAAPSVRTNP